MILIKIYYFFTALVFVYVTIIDKYITLFQIFIYIVLQIQIYCDIFNIYPAFSKNLAFLRT